ncbi:substrate-binding domain-containing protein [Comamonas sp. 26]|uniref:substrate-binding domain-containing protein n=1 Tax=Comamonas sp. 26 TaxID=2035201 RepID=UPI00119826A2|nr:substrate-binding domain-containing protein [Comamonas sp. 26]
MPGTTMTDVTKALGWQPRRLTQSRHGEASRMVALMSSMPYAVAGGPSRLGFMMEVASVAAGCALEQGMAMVLVPPLESGQRSLDFMSVDGVVLIEPAANDKLLMELTARGLPVVSIGKPGGHRFNTVPYVDLRPGDSVQHLLEHLQAQGARQIAMILGAAERDSYAQAEVAYQHMAHAMEMEHMVLRVDEALGEAGGGDAARHLLASYPQIDALLVLVDVLAVGVMQHVHQIGLRIPQDIKIATRYAWNASADLRARADSREFASGSGRRSGG